jgi:hypothetical protein
MTAYTAPDHHHNNDRAREVQIEPEELQAQARRQREFEQDAQTAHSVRRGVAKSSFIWGGIALFVGVAGFVLSSH